jgi:S1-C subfamily serine protease
MSDVLKSLSDAMADTVEAAGAGTVRIEGRRRLAATGIVWSDNGLIVTAHHVLRRDEGITIGLPDGSTAPATVVGRDPHTDLAVLRVETAVTPLKRADGDPLRVGHLALALGRPGNNLQTTLGVISAIGTGRRDGIIQTDVVMYPGFSGGPLIDAAGNVRGMNTSGFMRGASITIAVSAIERIVAALVEHGHVQQGYLGVGAQPVRLAQELAESLGQETGLMLASVEADSPAAEAGLYQGDIIVKLDGEPTPGLDDLLSLLTANRVGQSVPVTVIRGGQTQELTVTIKEKS